MSLGSNAAAFIDKMLQEYDGNKPQNDQSNVDNRNKAVQQMSGETKDGEKGQRSYRYPWYEWYEWYGEYKKHKHGKSHKHHKKHHHHDIEYYYSSYEDNYKKHLIIPSGGGGGKKHIVIPKDDNEGKKKHLVIPNDRRERKKNVASTNGDGTKKGVFSGLGMLWGKRDEQTQESDGDQESEQNDGSKDSKGWKLPEYGSGEGKKGVAEKFDNKGDAPGPHGFLQQLWKMYKSFREKHKIF